MGLFILMAPQPALLEVESQLQQSDDIINPAVSVFSSVISEDEYPS